MAIAAPSALPRFPSGKLAGGILLHKYNRGHAKDNEEHYSTEMLPQFALPR
jgi:hypothetical protein